jgi:hypothetical protein
MRARTMTLAALTASLLLAAIEPPVSDDRWGARLRVLSPIDLCPIVPGEAAPYPSCVKS